MARPLSQTAKTSPSHGEDMGSIPVGVTNLAGSPPALLKQVSFSQLVCGLPKIFSVLLSLGGGGNLAMFPKKETVVWTVSFFVLLSLLFYHTNEKMSRHFSQKMSRTRLRSARRL